MGPKPRMPSESQPLRPRLDEQIDLAHPLARLAELIDWGEIEHSFGAHFVSVRGRPALSPRLVAGLLYLQHAFTASDEAVVNTWDGSRAEVCHAAQAPKKYELIFYLFSELFSFE